MLKTNIQTYEKWERALDALNMKPNTMNYFSVCSMHFDPKHVRKAGKNSITWTLHPDAVPIFGCITKVKA